MSSISNDDLFLPRILSNSIEKSHDTHLESNYNNERDSQELIDIKQININDRNYKNKNINITSSTILDKLSSIKKKESKSTLNINIKTNTTNSYNNSPQNIIEEYKNRIYELETKLSQLNTYHMKEITKLNEEINIKNKNLKKLSNINKNMKISLNDLTRKLDELLYKFTKDQKKLISKSINNTNAKEKNFEEQLLLKEKELKNQQNMINILSKDNKKLRHSLEIQNTFELNRNLSDKLFIKEQEIINLNKIIKDYEHKYKKHNECQKEIDILKEKLINNQKELSEKKKEIFINHKNIIQLQSKYISSKDAINAINKNIKERKIKKNLKLSFDTNIINNSNNSLNPSNKYNSFTQNKKNLNSIPIQRDLSENNKNNRTIDISNNSNYNIIFNIFSKEEIDIIKKLYENKDDKFQEFIKKIEILEKYQNSKDRAYLTTIKRLKMKIDDYINNINLAENTLKDKDNKIFFLTRQIKELIKKKKELNDNNNKLIYLLNKSNKNYEEAKKAKIELSNLLFKYQNENIKESYNNESNIINELNIDINDKNDINKIIDNKEIIKNENKSIINDSNDKNTSNKIITDDSHNLIINKDIKNSEKDFELDSILSKNIIETPKKKKYIQYQINSNINHVEIKGIKNKNKEILFETQPIENNKNKLKFNGIKFNNSNQNIINKRLLFLPYKKSESVNSPNIVIKEKLKKNVSKRNLKRMSFTIRDKSESAIVNLLDSEKKGNINKDNFNKNDIINYVNRNSRINFLFEN